MSRSLRARGLKYNLIDITCSYNKVALFTGAWIEILSKTLKNLNGYVALFTGAWIEIIFKSK